MGIEVPYSQKKLMKHVSILLIFRKLRMVMRPLIWRGSEMMAISAQKIKYT